MQKRLVLPVMTGAACVLLLLLCILAIRPFAEIGLNDDWSYIYSAHVLATTGHVVYNGWAAFMLGWQLYLGALFIKLFGFSFTAVRASIVVLSLVTTALIHALLLRFGLRPWNAALGTCTLVLSPLFLPLAVSFMSDVPSLFCLLICLYGCLRAVQAESDRAANLWLIAAGLTNLAGGTVRQIAWLGVLVMVPATAWFLRRRRGTLATAAVVWLVSLAGVALTLHWFNHQPYVPVEKLIALKTTKAALHIFVKAIFFSVFTVFLLLLPILLGFASHYPLRDAKSRRYALGSTGLILAGVTGLSLFRHTGTRWMTLLLGNYVTAKGVDLPLTIGISPDILPRTAQACIALVVFITAALLLRMLYEARGSVGARLRSAWSSPLFWLFAPFLAATLVLIVTRSVMFDRYFLTLNVIAIVLLLRLYERRYHQTLPAVCALAVAVFAVYGVAVTHDLFNGARARLAAIDEVRATGVPRSQLRAGFEYDGWTQIELAGYMNDPRIQVPRNATTPWTLPAGIRPQCADWMYGYTPAIHARYIFSNEINFCYAPAPFAPVTYKTWLPPYRRTILILDALSPLPTALLANQATSPLPQQDEVQVH